MRLLLLCVTVLCAGCFGDRPRPLPAAPDEEARLSATVTAPVFGATVRGGEEITIQVLARDLNETSLAGVGFVARRFSSGLPTLDSAVVRFPARADTLHAFTFVVPTGLPTSTQIDIYGLAFSASGMSHRSLPTAVVVAGCVPGAC